MSLLLVMLLGLGCGACITLAYLAVAWESLQARMRARRRKGWLPL